MGTNKSDKSFERDQEHVASEFVRLITANQSQIYAYIMSLVGNCSDADDVLQETTATMWQKFDDFKPDTDFVAWGVAIAYYKVCEFRRKSSCDKYQFDDEVLDIISRKSKSEMLDSNMYLSKLKDCMDKLSSHDYQLIKLRYISGVGMNELSCRFNKTIRGVYYQIAKIHGLLMRCIERTISSEEQA